MTPFFDLSLSTHNNLNILELFPPVRTFIFEVDHVLTDGRIGLGTDNQAIRSFFARDLYAIRKAIQQGYHVSVVRPEIAEMLPAVFEHSGVTTIYERNQLPAGTTTADTLYMNALYTTALPADRQILYCCPADSVTDVKTQAMYISPFKGGKGCVYDVIEKVLKLNHRW